MMQYIYIHNDNIILIYPFAFLIQSVRSFNGTMDYNLSSLQYSQLNNSINTQKEQWINDSNEQPNDHLYEHNQNESFALEREINRLLLNESTHLDQTMNLSHTSIRPIHQVKKTQINSSGSHDSEFCVNVDKSDDGNDESESDFVLNESIQHEVPSFMFDKSAMLKENEIMEEEEEEKEIHDYSNLPSDIASDVQDIDFSLKGSMKQDEQSFSTVQYAKDYLKEKKEFSTTYPDRYYDLVEINGEKINSGLLLDDSNAPYVSHPNPSFQPSCNSIE